MSCYFRHMKEIFEEAVIEPTPANRKKLDQAIHKIMEVDYKECPITWKKLKQEVLGDKAKREEFVRKLTKSIN